MRQRRQLNELADGHLFLRNQINEYFSDYDNHKAEQVLQAETTILPKIEEIKNIATDKDIKEFYIALEYVLKGSFFLIRWTIVILSGAADADRFLNSAKANANMFTALSQQLDLTRPSLNLLNAIAREMEQVTKITEVSSLVVKLSKIPLPIFFTSTEDSIVGRFNSSEVEQDEPASEPPVVISVLFYIDRELWANPQILKKEQQYSIKGSLKFSRWPDQYNKLLLSYASTTDDDWFILSLPEISNTSEKEIEIEGSILFKYVQASFDTPISIRLVGRFLSESLPPLYPQLIGYDELKVRIADLSSFPYLTGYDKLNQKAFDILNEVQKEIPGINNEEMHNFMTLLSSILNYQGFCSQFAEYKNITSLSENEFRDRLIRYLAARNIASDIGKEGHLAGGRVEINYKGIIAELNIENETSDRTTIVDKYKDQPAAYASAALSQLAILCILDIQKKTMPPGLAVNNVFLVRPNHHGFETAKPEFESRLAIVIIDANTPDPSRY